MPMKKYNKSDSKSSKVKKLHVYMVLLYSKLNRKQSM